MDRRWDRGDAAAAGVNGFVPMRARFRIAGAVLPVAIFVLIAGRIPLGRFLSALRDADYATFLALMVPNTLFFSCWDTLVLKTAIRWFHADVPYRGLLPARAASYVMG